MNWEYDGASHLGVGRGTERKLPLMKTLTAITTSVLAAGSLAACGSLFQSPAEKSAWDEWNSKPLSVQQQECAAWTLMGGDQIVQDYENLVDSDYGQALDTLSEGELSGGLGFDEETQALAEVYSKAC